MQHALELAEKGRGLVEPNPLVGCVLLRDRHILGKGFHAAFGQAHAETAALADAVQRHEDVAGCTAIVTLEPCSHQGKTPPCVQALIAARVKKVVAAMQDPDPRVSGKGFAVLRDAGITVEVGPGEAQSKKLNAPFIKRTTKGLPWVIAKWAQTLDGKVATAVGNSQWISNEHSRKKVHELRARVDAILVGVGTAITDNPSLTARNVEIKRAARRIIADRSGRLPPQAKMLHDGGPPVTVITGDLETALRQLSADGVTNVLLEGGPTLTSAMLDAGLVDEAWVFLAPKLLGDATGLSAVAGRSCEKISDSLALHLEDVEQLNGDVWLRYLTRN